MTQHPHISDILLVSSEDVSSKPKFCQNEVIVGYQCGTAVLRGAHVFAPGVMAAPAGQCQRVCPNQICNYTALFSLRENLTFLTLPMNFNPEQ